MVTYKLLDDPGEESGVVYVSCFRAVAKLQLREDTRLINGKTILVGSDNAGLGFEKFAAPAEPALQVIARRLRMVPQHQLGRVACGLEQPKVIFEVGETQ